MEEIQMKTIESKSRKTNLRIRRGIIIFILCVLPFISFSQQNDQDKTLSPYFLVLGNDSSTDRLPLKSTDAEVNIVGVIADVTVNQVYKNEGKNAIEAIYTFPASTNAAVYAMEMTIGKRKIIAKIEEKEKARKEYEQAKEEGKRTSLLEQSRPNVFQMNVANIMPGDEIKVSLKYTEMLIPEKGTYKFVYPTVVGPRYSEKSSNNASSSDNFVSSPYGKAGKAPYTNFDINVNLSAGMPIQNVICSTHKTKISYPQTSIARINLDKTETKGGNRDFVLEYQLSGDKIESGLLLYEHGDENFFMLMMQPPKNVKPKDIPPREYIFIADVSGSMRGFPMDVTKKLLRNLVVNLRPTDRFNILVFAGTSGWMSDVSVLANSQNVEKAISFIDNHNGRGSTRLLPAMQKALNFPRKDLSVSRSFVVVTDGYIDVEQEVFDLIRKNCDRANTFTFGIGSSVNRYLIEGMAHAGNGEPLIVLNEKEANKEAGKFRNYINKPVLTQVKKVFSNFNVYDVEPISIPDVLAERPVIIYGKYKGKAKGTIKIKGYTGKQRFSKTFNVSNVKADKKNSALRYLWARKRIQMLDDYNNLSYNDDRVKEVTELGLKYNLLTNYTSFLAVEENLIANDNKLTQVRQALPMPEGVPNSAVGFDMEIDGTDISFAFYNEIMIVTNIPKSYKKVILYDIEYNFVNELNNCFGSYKSIIDNIEVTVNTVGKIINIEINGKSIDPEMKKCILKVISKWDFSSYKVIKEWKFRITF